MLIENAGIRRAVERSGVPLVEIAARLGWRDPPGESTRLARRLGMSTYHDAKGVHYSKKINAELAYRIRLAIHDTPYQRAVEQEAVYDKLFGESETDDCKMPTRRRAKVIA